ncbi:hypothetical protein CCZ01_02435 [Helicobacter monodelphidis]|uniref:hypothetical protein n=1 Tax=Helicobacter sp. 15-1451 TaxID=2004995 RepID=UPI000DCDCE0A|nr:hypothetical protein [Helicobacter sp. 15-1451]RAX58658.1 hypothetical protein CCZ01_02435 [Helicobacter sp. 15-1451]
MRIKLLAISVGTMFILGGCMIPNECGLSYNYNAKMTNFYDSQGMYHESCPKNIINYDEIRPRYGEHNPYVYDDLYTPVPADSPRGIQTQERERERWEAKQRELAELQGMSGGERSAYPKGQRPGESKFNDFSADWNF